MYTPLTHHAARSFWKSFRALPEEVQRVARKNFELLRNNPHHPSLHLKRVKKLWTVRAGGGYRAIGIDSRSGDCIVWLWIGPHDTYDSLLAQQ